MSKDSFSFLKKSELVKIIEDATKDADTFVKAEIDKVFDEYLSPKKDTLLKNPMPNKKIYGITCNVIMI